MPNTKSAIRRVRRVKKQTQVNRIRKSKYKTAVKKMELYIKTKENEKAKKYFSKFQSILMQVAKSGIINRNTAARKISRISKKIISKAIMLGGSSIKDFSSSSGKKGLFQQHFCVYGRKGENCSKTKCKGKIKKIVIANRASFFCNKCQK